MSEAFYPNPPLAQQDRDVLRVRAIAPEVAQARGYRTVSGQEATAYGFRGSLARAGLLIPSHNTQGEIDAWQTRPHDPPADDQGKPRKYLWATGTRLQIDVPPASLPYLRDVTVPIIITESILKADAIQSAIVPGTFCVIAISGVYGWRSEGMPLSDFGDIPWRRKERDRITFRRPVYVAFDSDTTTNPNVARARCEYTEFKRRRGGRVSWIDVPAAVNGDKQGIDDALAAGHTIEDMLRTAYPAPDIMPASFGTVGAAPGRLPEVERLRAENAQLQHDNAMLVHLIKNPYVQSKTKAVVVSIFCEAASKRSRGQVEHDGRIRLEARHVANDHRPIPQPGQPRAEVNPLDGSKPIVARSNIVGIAQKAAELGFVNLETVKERKRHSSGDWYWDTELLVTPAASLGAFLQPMSTYVPEDPTPRKPYTVQEPCPHCQQVHSRTRTTVCNGCGKATDVEILPIPLAQDPNASEADRVAMTKNLMARLAFGPPSDRPSRNSVSTKNVMADGRRVDPDTGEIMAS